MTAASAGAVTIALTSVGGHGFFLLVFRLSIFLTNPLSGQHAAKPKRFVTVSAAFLIAASAPVLCLADNTRADSLPGLVSELGSQPEYGQIVKQPLARAKSAMRRAAAAQKAGKPARAKQLEALGLEWAELGQALVSASKLEQQAFDLEKKLLERQAMIGRARTLLEQTVARIGRAKEKLEQLESAALDEETKP